MSKAAANRLILRKLLILSVAMFGFGYLMVPLYEKLCEVTGINQIGRADTPLANTQVDKSRVISMEFDANIRSDLPWQFRPLQSGMKVHPGELVQVMFEVRNNSDQAIAGQAIPSHVPQVAGMYMRKLDCFCFSLQTFAPGEVRKMPVTFVIEPGLPKDVSTVTLSYTFFKVEGAAPTAAKPRDERANAG